MTPLPAPPYRDSGRRGRVCLGVEAFSRYMTDEDWQLQDGLERAGCTVCGRFLPHDEVDTVRIASDLDAGVMVIPDHREWSTDSAIPQGDIAFRRLETLALDPTVFRVAIHKDAHQDPPRYRHHFKTIAPHAWIVYYRPDTVLRLSPFLRREHLIRTWHSVDADAVPRYSADGRLDCILSGAHPPDLYPLRHRLFHDAAAGKLPGVTTFPHPAYTLRGWKTPGYLKALAGFKVAICTASIFGYALRKIIEATACGCRVVTDLPADEFMPQIDANLIRVPSDISTERLLEIVGAAARKYEIEKQEYFAKQAIDFYNHRRRGCELASAIEAMRSR